MRTSGGRFLLLGGSLEASTLAQQLGQALPPFSRELDALIIPACGKADVSGLFGLTESFTLDTVYWGCDPERIQTTRRLYAAFQQAQIPQRRLAANDLIDLGGAQLAFIFGEESIAALQVNQQNFNAVIDYDPSALSQKNSNSLIVSAEIPKTAAAQLVLLTGALPIAQEDKPTWVNGLILANEYAWVETTTDGTNIWINGVR